MNPTPNIKVSPKLKAYMQRKDTSDIVVDTAQASTCGGPVTEAFAYLASAAKAERLVGEGAAVLSAQGVRVILAKRHLKCDAVIEFDLRRFMGLADIVVKGVHL